MSTIMEDLLLSEPAIDRTLTVDEALLLKDLSEADTAYLLEVRDMFDGTITVGEYDEEGEALKADKGVEAPPAVGDDRRGGSSLSRHKRLSVQRNQIPIWEDSIGREAGNEVLPGRGLRDEREPEF